jgi:hypothetical protein
VRDRFSAPVQTSSEVNTASNTMGTEFFLGVNQPKHGDDHAPHLVLRLMKVYGCTSTPPMVLHGLFKGELNLFLLHNKTDHYALPHDFLIPSMPIPRH